jgi:hypothetical protein
MIIAKKQEEMNVYDDIYTELYEDVEAIGNVMAQQALVQESQLLEEEMQQEIHPEKKPLVNMKKTKKLGGIRKEKKIIIMIGNSKDNKNKKRNKKQQAEGQYI